MQTIFAIEFKRVDPDEFLTQILKEFAPKLTETDFAHKTLHGVMEKREQIIEIIRKFAPEWPVEKIARIDRAVLEIGVYEIVFSQEVPPVVAINEAIEIAKKYGDENSPKFINGVLSSVMNHYKPNQEKIANEA